VRYDYSSSVAPPSLFAAVPPSIGDKGRVKEREGGRRTLVCEGGRKRRRRGGVGGAGEGVQIIVYRERHT